MYCITMTRLAADGTSLCSLFACTSGLPPPLLPPLLPPLWSPRLPLAPLPPPQPRLPLALRVPPATPPLLPVFAFGEAGSHRAVASDGSAAAGGCLNAAFLASLLLLSIALNAR